MPDLHTHAAEASPEQRKYTASIDRCLASFDLIESWPDNIAFLNRLLKTIQANPNLPLPRSSDISDALSLCLVSSLPSGVQQRTLEVYSNIFSSRLTLERELGVFLTGLTPVLSHASTTVKSIYITLLSSFVIPLGIELRPFSRALILALLPGLEDEHDEGFDACVCLMDDLQKTLQAVPLFWSSFWLACISTSSPQRSGALNYLLRRLPSGNDNTLPISTKEDDVKYGAMSLCLSLDPGLLVRAFSCGLRDHNPLVQRGFLELLISSMKISSPAMMNIPEEDRRLLLASSTEIVLRRDVALNRRLWTWLSVANTEDELAKDFKDLAADSLAHAMIDMLRSQPIKSSRIVLSLLDREDIGNELIRTLFPEIIMISYLKRNDVLYKELITSSRAIFEAVPVQIITAYLWNICQQENFELANFMLQSFDFETDETLVKLLPTLFLDLLSNHANSKDAIQFADRLMRLFTVESLLLPVEPILYTNQNICDYVTDVGQRPLVDVHQVSNFGFYWIFACFEALLNEECDRSLFNEILQHRLQLGPPDTTVREGGMVYAETLLLKYPILPFEHISGLTNMLMFFNLEHLPSSARYRSVCQKLCSHCWHYLGSSKLNYELSVVDLMSRLVSVMPHVDGEAFLAILVADELSSTVPIEKFTALWTHYATMSDRSLLRASALLVLDALVFGDSLKQSYILRWLHATPATAAQLMSFLLHPILHDLREEVHVLEWENLRYFVRDISASYDIRLSCYCLSLINVFLIRTGKKYLSDIQNLPADQKSCVGEIAWHDCANDNDVLCTMETTAAYALQADLKDHASARQFYEHCIEILFTLSGYCTQTLETLEDLLNHKLIMAISRRQYDLQELFLVALRRIATDSSISRSVDETLSSTLLQGLALARAHPVLQDYLTCIKMRSDLEQSRHSSLLLVECVVEQIDLNLIDIDAVLTIDKMTETTTAHENVMLLLDALEYLGLTLLVHEPDRSTGEASSQQTSSFMNGAFSFGASSADESNPTQTKGLAPTALSSLTDIVRTAVNIWLWAKRTSTSSSPSVTFISRLFLHRSFDLLARVAISHASSEILRILVDSWNAATIENRENIRNLCYSLFPEEHIVLLCRNIRSSLSFNISQSKRSKEEPAYRNMLYAISALGEDGGLANISAAVYDIVTLLRHFTLHLPSSGPFNAISLRFSSLLCARAIRTPEGQQRKYKRELSDYLLKIYGATVTLNDQGDVEAEMLSFLMHEIPNLPSTFMDMEKSANAVGIVITNLIQPQLKAKHLSMRTVQIWLKITALSGVKKLWKREIQDYFNDSHFFRSEGDQASYWCAILGSWLEGEKDKIMEYLTKPNANAPGQLFISTEADRLHKAAQLRRAAFIMMAMPIDANLSRMPILETRLREGMAGSSSIQMEAMLLIQAIVLQISEIHLKNIWISLITSMRNGFQDLISTKQGHDVDGTLLYTTLKTLDMLLSSGFEGFQS